MRNPLIGLLAIACIAHAGYVQAQDSTRPNVVLIITDDVGYGDIGSYGAPDVKTPNIDGLAKSGTRLTDFYAAPSCSPTRAALITGRNHHSVGFGVVAEQATGYPGYDSIIGPENATIGRILQQNGYATSWFGKEHNTPSYRINVAGPFDQWPVGMGFDYFYGFMGGESDQWEPYLFRNTTQIFPSVGKPGYNLITDMADEAIDYLNKLNAAAPDKPFFLYYVPGATHAPHQPKPAGKTIGPGNAAAQTSMGGAHEPRAHLRGFSDV